MLQVFWPNLISVHMNSQVQHRFIFLKLFLKSVKNGNSFASGLSKPFVFQNSVDTHSNWFKRHFFEV